MSRMSYSLRLLCHYGNVTHKQSQTTFYQIPIWSPTWLDSLQKTINKLFAQTDSFLGLTGSFQNWDSAVVMKSGKERGRNKQHSLSSNIFWIIKVKVGLK